MAEQPRTSDASALGESWVVASTTSIQEKDSRKNDEPMTPTPLARAGRRKELDRNEVNTTKESTDSLTSSWTMSGPELIMPSIQEAPISEASWVAPVRSKDQTSESIRRRRKISKEDTTHGHLDASSASKPVASSEPTQSSLSRLETLFHGQSTYVRMAINTSLLILILHLLFIPEIIYQAQSLCNVPTINTIYSKSCIRMSPRPFHPSNAIITPEETLTQAQTHLESIFTGSLDILAEHTQTLKETESMLSTLQSQLTSTFPNAHNALDLEFQGSDTALSGATREFDSLRADLRSAMDSLLASPITQDTSPPSITRDTRLAVQLRRRAEYLDRLRAQLASKADSLIARFATLDDHLEAMEGIVPRGAAQDRDRTVLQSILHSLSSYVHFPYLGQVVDSSEDAGKVHDDASSRPVSTLALLRLAATHHHPIVDAVSRLSQELAGLPRARAGGVW